MRGSGSTFTGWRARREYARGTGFSHARALGRLWMRRLLIAAYLVIGIVVANTHHYLGSQRLDTLEGILHAVLAVVLWPLVLAGVSMRV
jgi:cell shape-determining protein MreD